MSTYKEFDSDPIPVDCIAVDIDADVQTIGNAAFEAINRFSFGKSEIMIYEQDILFKRICQWVGARGIKSFERNYRFLLLEKCDENYKISPCDNFSNFQHQWFFEKDIVKVPTSCSKEELGQAILTGFVRSTYHPGRKDPKYKESKPMRRLP
jgi:hypothetical protein